jgi:tungstate transport system substrate-binding protein
MRLRRQAALFAMVALLVFCACRSATPSAGPSRPASPSVTMAATKPANPRLVLSTTTSTVDTGLLDFLIPIFEKQTGYQVVPLSLGSGQALATAARGEADVLLVHSPDAEQAFMANGDGVDRRLVMHNDFVINGPPSDPAHIKGDASAVDALTKISSGRFPFVSRGDDSGTNALELKLWKQAGITPKGQPWYIESGTGMGQTLSITSEKSAYTISDRGTYLAQQKNLQLAVLVEKDPVLLNIYHVIRTNPEKHNNLNVDGGKAFADFMVAPATQKLIGDFGKDKFGQALFVPDAGKSEDEVGK